MARSNFKCPIGGCRRFRKASQVMCRDHWYMVPAALRTNIWGLFTSERGSARHVAAIRRAIDHVNQQLDEQLLNAGAETKER